MWSCELSVVLGFILGWRDQPEPMMEAALVVPVDPGEGDPFDVVQAGERAVAERAVGRTASVL